MVGILAKYVIFPKRSTLREEQTITGLIPCGIMGGDILDTIYNGEI